jgi:hypothetical protein
MRSPLALLALLALAIPVAGLAAPRTGEGTLSVEAGHGRVVIQARGGIIGRVERGTITVYDLTPEDTSFPAVSGDDLPQRFLGDSGVQYRGRGMRFRLIGGAYKIILAGGGIDLSAVGNGYVILQGEGVDPGTYSLDGEDCRAAEAKCKPLPEKQSRFKLGSGFDRPEKASQKPLP